MWNEKSSFSLVFGVLLTGKSNFTEVVGLRARLQWIKQLSGFEDYSLGELGCKGKSKGNS